MDVDPDEPAPPPPPPTPHSTTTTLPSPYFEPFPRASTTLISAPPYSGKSYLIKQLVDDAHLYFRDPIERVVVVNCNQSITFHELKNGPTNPRPQPVLEQHVPEDFDADSLAETDLLVIDDLLHLTPAIRLLLDALVHHGNLVHAFVVVHGVLGNKNFEILNHVHRVCLFMRSSAVGRLASYLVTHFFFDADLKEYLKKVLAACERDKAVVTVEINNLPGTVQPLHVATSHLTQLAAGYCVVYPYPANLEMYENLVRERRVTSVAEPKLLPPAASMVPGSFLLLSSENVRSIQESADAEASAAAADADDDANGECLAKSLWNETTLGLETDLNALVRTRQVKDANLLLKELLLNDDVCILEDGRRMRLHSRPHVVAPILDFVATCSRREGPTERDSKSGTEEYRVFSAFVASLLSKNCPKMLLKNQSLWPSNVPSGRQRRQKRKNGPPKTRRRSRASRRRFTLDPFNLL